MPIQCAQLSDHDRSVLNAILNPLEFGGGSNTTIGETNLDAHIDLPENLIDQPDDECPSLAQSLHLEAAAVSLADAGNLAAALKQLTDALELTPNRASLFNNRAQVQRLAGHDEGRYFI